MKKLSKIVDWDKIEPDWRAGIKTKLQLSQEHGVSRAALDKHFGKLGVDRDLTAAINVRAQVMVTREAVTPEVTLQRNVTERAIVEANAEMIKNAVLDQRKDVQGYRKLINALKEELEEQTFCREDAQSLIEIIETGDMEALAKEARRVVSLPVRIKSAKELSETLKTLITLERTVMNISDDDDKNKKKEAPTINVIHQTIVQQSQVG